MDDIEIIRRVFEFHRDTYRGRNREKLNGKVVYISKRQKRGTDQTVYTVVLDNGNSIEIIRYANSGELVIYPYCTAKFPRYIEWDPNLGVAFDRNYYAAR